MSIQERMRMCRLIEQMEHQKEYSKKIGLKKRSTFCEVMMNVTYGNMEEMKK